MPILFGMFGIILIVAGVRNRVTSGDPSLMSLVKDDFTGNNPFWKWMLAILFIGAIGYIPYLRPISRGFLVLVILVFLLSNEGVFTELQTVFKSTSNTPTDATAAQNAKDVGGLGTDSELQLANVLYQIGAK